MNCLLCGSTGYLGLQLFECDNPGCANASQRKTRVVTGPAVRRYWQVPRGAPAGSIELTAWFKRELQHRVAAAFERAPKVPLPLPGVGSDLHAEIVRAVLDIMPQPTYEIDAVQTGSRTVDMRVRLCRSIRDIDIAGKIEV